MENSTVSSPFLDQSNPNNSSTDFDSLQFPPLDIDFLTNDLGLDSEGLMDDLGFDDNFDFSLDDLSFLSENEGFLLGDGSDVLSSSTLVNSRSLYDSDPRVSVPLSSHDSSRSVIDGFLNSSSPESGVVSASSPVSSCNDVVVVDDQKIKLEEQGKVCALKRKKEKEDENPNSNSRSRKFRRSITSTDEKANFTPEENKKKARLMRNRESAQLSRQRKKHYVEELEDKIRSMHSIIADLNGKISYIIAENANLRQQLSGASVVPPSAPAPPPGVYPPPSMAPIPYPWIPCASYQMKPQGSQVPLVPIPKLKPRQPISASKGKKSDSKKSVSKTKKVSSVSFLGLLLFVLLFWGLAPFVNIKYGGRNEMYPSVQPQGRVLTVSRHLNGSHQSVEVGLDNGKLDVRECGTNRVNCRKGWLEGAKLRAKQGKQRSERSPSSDRFENGGNSSEPLVASLYVPRNDKLVKIDGNLIIHSVLASEKAMASSRMASGMSSDKATVSLTNEVPQTGLAVPGDLSAALAVSNGGRIADRDPHVYRSPSDRHKALNSGSRDSNKDNSKSTAADGSLQKWFREGLAGPILSSGMCTEVFQFDVSSSANPGAIIPATSTVNVSAKHAAGDVNLSKRNRRILGHLPIPLPGSEFNSTEEDTGIPSHSGNFHSNKSVSSMVVSVLVDPREAGDIEFEGAISPKALSRIFVVVLIDSVKYVTYSCILPFKGSSSLVTT